MEKMVSDGPKQGQEDFFPTNPDLADILGRTDLNFEIFFFDFLDPKFPDAAADSAAAADGRTLRSQPDPSPNAPRDQIRRKDPCCDLQLGVRFRGIGCRGVMEKPSVGET